MWRQRVQATLSRGLGEVGRRVAKDSPGSSTEIPERALLAADEEPGEGAVKVQQRL